PLWIEALERQLADGGRSGRSFALLLVDLDSAERLRLAGPEEAADAFARAGRAVREEVRRPDVVAHEGDGRVWVIAGDTGRAGAGCGRAPGPCPEVLAAAQDEGADAADADVEEFQGARGGDRQVPRRVVRVGPAVDHWDPHDPAAVEELDPRAARKRAVCDA